MHERLAQCLEEELELQCGACNLPFGLDSDSLEALPCSHILHARYILHSISTAVVLLNILFNLFLTFKFYVVMYIAITS